MNKILLSIFMGLTLTAAMPAQAGWRDFLPTWLGGTPAQNQSAQAPNRDLEAQRQPQVTIPAAPQSSWLSTIFRNPVNNFYSYFSAWWNNDKQKADLRTEIKNLKGQLRNIRYENLLLGENEEKIAEIEALEQEAQILDPENKTGWDLGIPAAQQISESIRYFHDESNDLDDSETHSELKQLQSKRDRLEYAIANQMLDSTAYLQQIPKAKARIATLKDILANLNAKKQNTASLKNSISQTLRAHKNASYQNNTQIPAATNSPSRTSAGAIVSLANVDIPVESLRVPSQSTPKQPTISATIVIPQGSPAPVKKKDKKHVAFTLPKKETDNANFKMQYRNINKPIGALALPTQPAAQKVTDNLIGSIELMNPTNVTTPTDLTASFSSDVHVMAVTAAAASSSSAAKSDSERGFDKITEHIQMDPVASKARAELGKRYAHKLLTGEGPEIPTATQREYLDAIVALNWFFYDHALKEQKGFVEGTFVIEDRNFAIYNFFLNYLKRMNPDIKGDGSDPLRHMTTCPWGDSRDASHYVHLKHKLTPFGVDMRYELEDKKITGELTLLPAQKRHMLFGKIDALKQHIYVKPENHGLYWLDGLPGHTKEFLSAQGSKANMTGTIIRTLLAPFGIEFKSDDNENNRKERVPAEFVKQFTEAIKNAESLKARQKDLLKKMKQDGLKTLTAPEIVQSESPQIRALLDAYNKEYDDLEHRTGREIFISSNNLLMHGTK